MKEIAAVHKGGSNTSQLMKAQIPPEWWRPSRWQELRHNAAQSAHLPDPHLAAEIAIKDVNREHEVSLEDLAVN